MDISTIAQPALILLITGVLLGVLLGLADKFLKVQQDERLEKLIPLLPGYNCGVCGQPGCNGFASALLDGGVKISDCKPLKSDAADKIQEILA